MRHTRTHKNHHTATILCLQVLGELTRYHRSYGEPSKQRRDVLSAHLQRRVEVVRDERV